jgi:hypothetical protein
MMYLCGSAVVVALYAWSFLNAGKRKTSHPWLLRLVEHEVPVIKDPPRINL